jgi:hypothetical protein
MKVITYKKKIEVEATIPFPVITFVPGKVRKFEDGYSWDAMGYVARFDGLTNDGYHKVTGMYYTHIDKMLEAYVMETYHQKSTGYGSVDWHVYSGKDVNLPELPELENSNGNDDHADLVNMFKNL